VVFSFPSPSFEVMWFLYPYFPLLNYSSFEVLWFLSLHFLLLSCFVGLGFNFLILARCFYTYWIATKKIWKILLINFQLVLHNFFISSMINHIFLQLLCKVLLYNLPPFSIPLLPHNPSSCFLSSLEYNNVASIHNTLAFS